jgi:hypothetical protein
MKHQFNQNELVNKFSSESTFGDMIQNLEKEAESRNEVICKVTMNGKVLTEEQESIYAKFPLRDILTLEVESSNPQDILINILKDWVENLPFLIQECDKVSEALRFQSSEVSFKLFSHLLKNCNVFIRSLDSIFSYVKMNLGESQPVWFHNEKATMKSIQEATQAFQEKNISLLADIVEYDLAHILQMWKELLHNICIEKTSELKGKTFGGSAR